MKKRNSRLLISSIFHILKTIYGNNKEYKVRHKIVLPTFFLAAIAITFGTQFCKLEEATAQRERVTNVSLLKTLGTGQINDATLVQESSDNMTLGIATDVGILFIDISDPDFTSRWFVQDGLPLDHIAFSPDSALVAVSGNFDTTEGFTYLRNVETRDNIELSGSFFMAQQISAITFRPDSLALAAATTNGEIVIWSTETGEILAELEDEPGIEAIAYEPDGKILATAGRLIRLWNIETSTEITALGESELWINTLAFSPDGSSLAYGDSGGTVRLWNLHEGEEILEIKAHESSVTELTFYPNGSVLASAAGSTVYVWDTETMERLATLSDHKGEVNSLAFSPDGSVMVSTDSEAAYIWNTSDYTMIASHTLPGHQGVIEDINFSPDGTLLATASGPVSDNTVRLWDTETGTERLVLHGGAPIAFSPNGELLAYHSSDNVVTIRDIESEITHVKGKYAIAFTQDGSVLVTDGTDGRSIQFWDVRTGDELYVLGNHSDTIVSIALSPDGNLLASADSSQQIKIWDIGRRKELASFVGAGHAYFDATGQVLAYLSDPYTVVLWNMQAQTVLTIFEEESIGRIQDFSFVPDSNYLIYITSSGRLRLWDIVTHEDLWNSDESYARRFEGVRSITFAPDGKTFAYSTLDITRLMSLSE